MTTADLKAGMNVIYVPHHAKGRVEHPHCEPGVVVDWEEVATDRVLVAVRYGNAPNAQSTALENLRPS